LRQAIRATTSDSDVNLTIQDCTEAQRRNSLLDCPENSGASADSEDLTRWVFASDTEVEPARGRRVAGILAENRQRLMAGLNAANLEADDYLLQTEQLEAGIEVYRGQGNAPLQRLQDQIYRNDAAYQQAQRALNPR